MDPLTLLAIGAGAGLLKNYGIDQPKADRERKLAAETMRWSPWTGMTPKSVEEPDMLGSLLSYGLTGAQLGAGLQAHEKAMADPTPQFVYGGPSASAWTGIPKTSTGAVDFGVNPSSLYNY